jgi:hypothetical protein
MAKKLSSGQRMIASAKQSLKHNVLLSDRSTSLSPNASFSTDTGAS